jgi:hypothetical protein
MIKDSRIYIGLNFSVKVTSIDYNIHVYAEYTLKIRTIRICLCLILSTKEIVST